MSYSIGALARLAVEPGSGTPTFDGSSERYGFVSESLQARKTIIHHQSIVGTRTRRADRSRFGIIEVGGSIVFETTQYWFDNWMPRVLGAAENADVFDVAETVMPFAAKIDRVGDIFMYQDCKVNQWTLTPGGDGVLQSTLDIFSKQEWTAGQTWEGTIPDLGSTNFDKFLVLYDATVTLESSSRQVETFTLTVNNNLQRKYRNTRRATDLVEGIRDVTFTAQVPFTSTEAAELYDQGVGGAAASIVLEPAGVVAGVSVTITLRDLQIADVSPVVGSPDEVMLTLSGQVTSDGTAVTGETLSDIQVTNDQTP